MAEETHKTSAAAPRAVIEQVPAQADAARGAADSGAASGARDAHTPSVGGFQQTTMGFFQGVGRKAWAVADANPHATLYALIGFVLAVLILVIGVWDTIVIAVFVALGALLGHMVDNNGGRKSVAKLFGKHR